MRTKKSLSAFVSISPMETDMEGKLRGGFAMMSADGEEDKCKDYTNCNCDCNSTETCAGSNANCSCNPRCKHNHDCNCNCATLPPSPTSTATTSSIGGFFVGM